LDYTNERQLQRIENGETACFVDKLMEITQILNSSIEFLLFGVEEKSGNELETIPEEKTKSKNCI
jgi:hypothetical protein